jgi:hypothetical protein
MKTMLNSESNVQLLPSASHDHNTMLSDAVFRPMLFSTPMVKALLSGSKTQTRRIVKQKIHFEGTPNEINNPLFYSVDGYELEESVPLALSDIQKIKIGDIIWVRETWSENPFFDDNNDVKFLYKSIDKPFEGHKWKSSRFMKKEVCRIWLKVVNVRVERLQDISEQDAINEGVLKDYSGYFDSEKKYCYVDYDVPRVEIYRKKKQKIIQGQFNFAKDSYQSLWKKINGIESWSINPWVWVYDFEVSLDCPHGFR